jgi:L-seryl-tRNA(Ser) seleniumtransferase
VIDLKQFGLPDEPVVADRIAAGASIVTFSGDKLLGGPQAGFIVGRRELLARINRNPMKRALRLDKVRLAALEATLKLYRDPDRLAQRLPTVRLLARPESEIEALARRLQPAVSTALGRDFTVDLVACASQIGSGALPLETLPSAGLAIRPTTRHAAGQALTSLAASLRALPIPVIGRIENQSLILDLRCLEDEALFVSNLSALTKANA